MNTSRVFLTDGEFEEVFGWEIFEAVKILEKYAKDKCPACKGKCCWEIECEFYSEKFSSCPIYEIRPAKCRFYFCKEIIENASLTKKEKELLDKPIKDLSRTIKDWWGEIFLSFPLKFREIDWLARWRIKERVTELIKSFENDKIDENRARDLLKKLIKGGKENGLENKI